MRNFHFLREIAYKKKNLRMQSSIFTAENSFVTVSTLEGINDNQTQQLIILQSSSSSEHDERS